MFLRRPRPPGRDPVWARLMVGFGALLIVASTGVVGAERMLAARVEHAVRQETLLAPEARVTQDANRTVSVRGPLNYLIIGSDARPDSPDAGRRSDTILIAHVPASLEQAYLVSVPRDLQVKIPPWPQSGFFGGLEKINGAFEHGGGGTGGVGLLSQTLSDLMGLQFNGAVVIDFEGFRKVVDQLGGVDMCVDVRTESIHIGFDQQGNFLPPRTGWEGEYYNPLSTPKVYEPGCWHFAGWEALDYVRQRKSLPNGDYDRQRHQQEFIRAIGSRIKDQGLVANPVELDRLLQAVGESLTVDTNGVPLDELAYALRRINPGALVGVTIPSEPQMIGGISYVTELPDAETLYRALRDDALAAWTTDHSSWAREL